MFDVFEECKGLRAQDRLVYIRWNLLMQGSRQHVMSIVTLAEKLKLKASMVRSSIARLCLCGYIEVFPKPKNTREQLYAIKKRKGDSVFFYGDKDVYIKALLGLGEDLTQCRAEELSKRFMKAVLVYQSNSIGLIPNVGFNKLSTITGLSVQRLRRYKDELLDEEFMLKFIAGGNAPKLYKKSQSIFILDPTYFGGGLLKIQCFPEEELFYFNANEMIDKALTKRNMKREVILKEEVEEINRHRLASRVNHYFDELVSQYLAKNEYFQGKKLEVSSLAETDSPKLNKALESLCSPVIKTYSKFIMLLLSKMNENNNFIDQTIKFYFFRNNDELFVVSNANHSYTGEIKWINRVDVKFQGKDFSWKL